MKQKTKKDIKDMLQIIALCAAGGIVVFHVNSFFKPAGPANAGQRPQGIERMVETVDSIIPGGTIRGIDSIQAAREMFFGSLHSGRPQR